MGAPLIISTPGKTKAISYLILFSAATQQGSLAMVDHIMEPDALTFSTEIKQNFLCSSCEEILCSVVHKYMNHTHTCIRDPPMLIATCATVFRRLRLIVN